MTDIEARIADLERRSAGFRPGVCLPEDVCVDWQHLWDDIQRAGRADELDLLSFVNVVERGLRCNFETENFEGVRALVLAYFSHPGAKDNRYRLQYTVE